MKVNFILLCFLLIPVYGSTSSLLFRAGYTLSTMVGEDSPLDNYSRAPEPGFGGALGYAHSFSKISGVVELSYLQKGVRYMDTEQSGIIVNMDYVTLPLYVQYSIGKGDMVFTPGAGFAPAYLIKTKSFSYIHDERISIETREIRKFDISLFIDLEFARRLPKGSLALSLRPEFSLITNDPTGETSDHSFTGLISIVYKLPVNSK